MVNVVGPSQVQPNTPGAGWVKPPGGGQRPPPCSREYSCPQGPQQVKRIEEQFLGGTIAGKHAGQMAEGEWEQPGEGRIDGMRRSAAIPHTSSVLSPSGVASAPLSGIRPTARRPPESGFLFGTTVAETH